MSYLLTEVAMEMLGWRFYDADGVPRPINFEGAENEVCEGVENLATLIGAPRSNKHISSIATSVVKAEADSSSNVAQQISDVIDLDADSPVVSDSERTFDDFINDITRNSDAGVAIFSAQNIDNNESYASGLPAKDTPTVQDKLQAQELLPTTDSNITNVVGAPFDLKIQYVQGGYDISNEEDEMNMPSDNESVQQPQFSIVKVTSAGNDVQPKFVLKSVKQAPTSIDTNKKNRIQQCGLPNTSTENKKNVSTFIDLTDDSKSSLEIDQLLDNEIDKIATDLNRHKNIFYDAIPDVLKHPLPAYLSVIESYREQEYKNLEKELKNIQALCLQAERKSYAHFGQTYSKYLNISRKLNAKKQKQLETSNVKIENVDSKNIPSPNNAILAIKGRKQVARKKTSSLNLH